MVASSLVLLVEVLLLEYALATYFKYLQLASTMTMTMTMTTTHCHMLHATKKYF